MHIMQIGDFKPENNIFLAPMAGITDKPFRIICARQGCGMTTTEMVSAKGLFYNDQKSWQLIDSGEYAQTTAIQIFGSDPEIMRAVTYKLNGIEGAALDINMGCPAPKVVKSGDGSALMKTPELAYKVMKAVCEESTKPVTVKIRKGWDEESVNAVEIAKMAEQAGVKAITVHGRTRNQFYSGNADWDIIKKVKQAVSIPVIGNGDVNSPQRAKQMLEKTGCDGIMIGRAAQGNPWIFAKTLHYMKAGKTPDIPDLNERKNTIFMQLDMLSQIKDEHIAVCEMRKHIAWYIKGLRNAAHIKNAVFSINNKNEVYEVLTNYFRELEERS